MSSFLLYAPLTILGLIVLIVVGALLYKLGDTFDSIKDFFSRLFGAIVFYGVSLGVAYVVGKVLEYIVHPLIMGGLPAGIDHRLYHAPMLYILLGLGSLHIIMPDSWATSRWGGYVSWLISGAMIVLVGGYALGIFPPVSMWTADSFLSLDPALQAFIKWLWPPVYPGVTGFADGC